MKKRIVKKIKDIVLTFSTAIATVQMIVAIAMFGGKKMPQFIPQVNFLKIYWIVFTA